MTKSSDSFVAYRISPVPCTDEGSAWCFAADFLWLSSQGLLLRTRQVFLYVILQAGSWDESQHSLAFSMFFLWILLLLPHTCSRNLKSISCSAPESLETVQGIHADILIGMFVSVVFLELPLLNFTGLPEQSLLGW